MVETEIPSHPSGNHSTRVASPVAAAIPGLDRQSGVSFSRLRHLGSLLVLVRVLATGPV